MSNPFQIPTPARPVIENGAALNQPRPVTTDDQLLAELGLGPGANKKTAGGVSFLRLPGLQTENVPRDSTTPARGAPRGIFTLSKMLKMEDLRQYSRPGADEGNDGDSDNTIGYADRMSIVSELTPKPDSKSLMIDSASNTPIPKRRSFRENSVGSDTPRNSSFVTVIGPDEPQREYKIQNLIEKCSAYESEVSDLQKQLAALSSQLAHVSEKATTGNTAEQQSSETRDELDKSLEHQSHAMREEFRQAIEERNHLIIALRNELLHAASIPRSGSHSPSELENALREEIAIKDAIVNQLSEKLEQHITEEDARQQEYSRTMDEAEEKFARMADEYNEAVAGLEQQIQDLQESPGSSEELERLLQEKDAEIQCLKMEKIERTNALELDNKELQEKVSNLTAQLQNRTQGQESANSEIISLKEQLRQSIENAETFTSQHKTLEDDLHKRITETEADKHKIETAHRDRTVEVEQLNLELEGLKQNMADTKAQLTAREEELTSLRQAAMAASTASSQVEALNEMIATRNNELEQLRKDNASLHQSIINANNRLLEHESTIETLQADKDETKQEAETLRREIQVLEGALDDLETENNQVKEQLDLVEDRNLDLQAKLSAYEASAPSSAADSDTRSDRSQTPPHLSNPHSPGTPPQLTDPLGGLPAAHPKSPSKLATAKATITSISRVGGGPTPSSELSDLRSDKAALEADIADLQHTIAGLEADNADLQQTVSDLEHAFEQKAQDHQAASLTALETTNKRLHESLAAAEQAAKAANLAGSTADPTGPDGATASALAAELAALQNRRALEICGMQRQIKYYRGVCAREERFRAGLVHEKHYLGLQIEQLRRSQRETLHRLHQIQGSVGHGGAPRVGFFDDEPAAAAGPSSVKSVAIAIIAINRLKALAADGRYLKKLHSVLVQKTLEQRRRKLAASTFSNVNDHTE